MKRRSRLQMSVREALEMARKIEAEIDERLGAMGQGPRAVAGQALRRRPAHPATSRKAHASSSTRSVGSLVQSGRRGKR